MTNTKGGAPHTHPIFPLPLCFYSLFFVRISLSLTALQHTEFETRLSSSHWVGQQGFKPKAPGINTSLWLVLILSLLMVDVCCQNSWKVSAVICYTIRVGFNEQSPSLIFEITFKIHYTVSLESPWKSSTWRNSQTLPVALFSDFLLALYCPK